MSFNFLHKHSFFVILLSVTIGLSLWSLNQALASGSIAGNPADDNPHAKPLVWFLGDQPIKWCVHMGEADKLYASPERSVLIIRSAFEYWRKYLDTKRLSDEWYSDVPFIALNNEFRTQCQGDEDLAFYVGTADPLIEKLKSQYKNPSGFAELLSYDEQKGWGKGLIWIKEYRNSGQTFSSEFEFSSVLLHEMGHVLGCGHVEGTIMSSDLIGTLNKISQVNLPSGYTFRTNIDLQKEMYFSPERGLHALSYYYLHPTAGQKELVKMLLGVELKSPLNMGFIQGEGADRSKVQLYIAYEGSIPLAAPKVLRGLDLKERGTYVRKNKFEGKVFVMNLDFDTLIRFNTSDNPIFRVLYRGKEMSMKVPGYLVQGHIVTESGSRIPIVYGRNKGDDEYVRISALVNNQQILFFEATMATQPFW